VPRPFGSIAFETQDRRLAAQSIKHSAYAAIWSAESFRDQAAQSPIDAIDDPVVGGATAIIAIAKECESWDAGTQEKLNDALLAAGEEGLVAEAVVYSDWATKQFMSQTDVLSRLGHLVASMLNLQQR